jgi:hypothetical protein
MNKKVVRKPNLIFLNVTFHIWTSNIRVMGCTLDEQKIHQKVDLVSLNLTWTNSIELAGCTLNKQKYTHTFLASPGRQG